MKFNGPLTLKDLSALRYQRSREQHANVPEYALPRKVYSDKDANRLTESIVDAFDLTGNWASRISNEGRFIESIGKRIPSNSKRGLADVHAIFRGKHISIEIKIGNDKQSDHQKKIQAEVERAGGIYRVVKTWNDFAQFFYKLQNGSI